MQNTGIGKAIGIQKFRVPSNKQTITITIEFREKLAMDNDSQNVRSNLR